MSSARTSHQPAPQCTRCPIHCTGTATPVALSQREREVLRGWLLAPSKLEAAAALFISMGTMNTHLSRIRVKYSEADRPASTKSALLARALQDGIVALHEL